MIMNRFNKKKIFRIILTNLIIVAISLCIYFFKNEESILGNVKFYIDTLLVLFGFSFTCYTFVLPIVNKVIKKVNDNNFKEKRDIYLKNARECLITIFILILMILFLDFLYHCNFNILWLKCTIDYFMVHGFIFAIGLSLDFFLSVFTICKCSNELDE
nr:MAG TPA: hypothetical protein [Caudoviricetes sp.]